MSAPKRLFPYWEVRALEDAEFGQGLTPTRLFRLLLPVWQVEVRATTTEGRPYELIDRYLERGIAEGGLTTAADLSTFFALDPVLVDRALRVLTAIGHVTPRDGRLELTELGRRSLRDQTCYLVTRQDRRKMYFDGYHSRPLSRRYYDPGVVTFLAPADIAARGAGVDRFRMLAIDRGFRRAALSELAAQGHRHHYNLPHRIDRPESLGEECVYLPLYVVRALDGHGRTRTLVYSQAADVADPELSSLCEQTPQIEGVLRAEELAAGRSRTREEIVGWLSRKGVRDGRLTRLGNGRWRVVLPPSSFAPKGGVPLSLVASFAVLETGLAHIWCEQRAVRERALVDRLDAMVGVRAEAVDVLARIERVSEQLGLNPIDVAGVRKLALDAGRTRLAARLAEGEAG